MTVTDHRFDAPRPRGLYARRAVTPARASVRAYVLGMALGLALALARRGYATVPEALHTRGLEVTADCVHWLDPPGLLPRRALVLAAEPGNPDDVYAVTVRTGSRDKVITLDDVSNLTRSPDAREQSLEVHGRWAVFATAAGPSVHAFTVVDTRREPDAGDAPMDVGARFRAAVTRWQETGWALGYGFYRLELSPRPRELALGMDGDVVTATAPGQRTRIDASTHAVLAGASWVTPRPRVASDEGWTGWAVNTVRAIPWVGPVPITWLEHLVFNVQDRVARVEVQAGIDHSAGEVVNDLAAVFGTGSVGEVDGTVTGWPPERLSVPFSPALPREGEWAAAGADDPYVVRNPGAPPAFYQSYVRTDRLRPDTRVYVTVWDPRQVELHIVPGSQEPMGATGETGTGSVPRDARTLTHLAAGFNGGFQALHGEWGVYAEGTLFLPPKPWGATIFALAGGGTAFGSWTPESSRIPPNVIEFRQNLTSLVEDGVFNPYHRGFWGGNVPGSAPGESHTARTGVCLTREGFVAFFWGDALTERSLADAMLATRCAYGIHLDMNGSNTGFEFLKVTPVSATPPLRHPPSLGHEAEGPVPSAPGFIYRARRMVRGMHEMSFPRYIRRDPRDYFYLLLRPVLPGRALVPPLGPAQTGEGEWHVSGLGPSVFPWPMARTHIRPDPGHPDRWVNLVRVDPRRVALGPPDAHEGLIARGLSIGPPVQGAPRWTAVGTPDTPRWTVSTEGAGWAGVPLGTGTSAVLAVCTDVDWFMVFAVADRAERGLMDRALDLAGCTPERMDLGATSALTLPDGPDAVTGTPPPVGMVLFTLIDRVEPLGVREFPEVHPVGQSVWYDAQHRRVRYQRSETGGVQVNILGGRSVSVPSWGGNQPLPGTTPPTGTGTQTPPVGRPGTPTP